MAFLGANNFDFNTLFRDGISYCDEDEAKRLRDQFNEKLKLMESLENKKVVDEQVVAVPIEEQEHLDKLKWILMRFMSRNFRFKFFCVWFSVLKFKIS